MLAVEALGALKQVGPSNRVATALTMIIGDKNAPLNVRTAATRALGGLNYQGASSLKPRELAVTLAQFAVAASTIERRRKIETTAAPLTRDTWVYGGTKAARLKGFRYGILSGNGFRHVSGHGFRHVPGHGVGRSRR